VAGPVSTAGNDDPEGAGDGAAKTEAGAAIQVVAAIEAIMTTARTLPSLSHCATPSTLSSTG